MDEKLTKTSLKQRIFIGFIAFLMLGSFAAVISASLLVAMVATATSRTPMLIKPKSANFSKNTPTKRPLPTRPPSLYRINISPSSKNTALRSRPTTPTASTRATSPPPTSKKATAHPSAMILSILPTISAGVPTNPSLTPLLTTTKIPPPSKPHLIPPVA